MLAVFPTNSFEQLCINYANEKLQFHFNEVIFHEETAMYVTEGISLEEVEFEDNALCVNLIEAKPFGIFRSDKSRIIVAADSSTSDCFDGSASLSLFVSISFSLFDLTCRNLQYDHTHSPSRSYSIYVQENITHQITVV